MDKMRQGDLLPKWKAYLFDDDTPVDLTTAVSVTVYGVQNGDLVLSEAVTGTSGGVVEMQWPTGSTAALGYIDTVVRVVWPGPKPQTFPPRGWLRTTIYRGPTS